MDAHIAAVICAAGSSSRMGGVKKEYRFLGPSFIDDKGKNLTVLGASAEAFAAFAEIGPIVITVPPIPPGADNSSRAASENESAAETETAAKAASSIPEKLLNSGRVFFVSGGRNRRASVYNALSFIKLKAFPVDYVLIHDGARPWVPSSLIKEVIEAALRHKAAVPVTPALETPKLLDNSGFVKFHLKRTELGLAQTPQGFAFPEILYAHEKAARRENEECVEYTDDAEVWGEFSGPVAAVPGSPENRKITFPGDLA